MQYLLSDNNGIKLEINEKKTLKNLKLCGYLKNTCIKEISREIEHFWNEWRLNDLLKFMGCSESSAYREIHSIECIHWKRRKLNNW